MQFNFLRALKINSKKLIQIIISKKSNKNNKIKFYPKGCFCHAFLVKWKGRIYVRNKNTNYKC